MYRNALPPDIQQNVNMARLDPLNYLDETVNMISGHPDHGSFAAHPQLLSLYLSQFASPPPPLHRSLTQREIMELRFGPVSIAFFGLSFVIRREDVPPDVEHAIMKSWSQFWPWIQFYYHFIAPYYKHEGGKSFGPNPIETKEGNDYMWGCGIRFIIEDMLQYLLDRSFDHSTVSTVCKTPGVLKLATEMYLNLGQGGAALDDFPNMDLYSNRVSQVSDLLLVLCTQRSSKFNEVFQALDLSTTSSSWRRKRATMAFFAPLRRVLQPDMEWSSSQTVHVLTIHTSLFYWNTSLHEALDPEVIVQQMCNAIIRASIAVSSPDIQPKPFMSLVCFLRFSCEYFTKATHDHSWVIFALRLDILSIVIEAARQLSRPENHPPRDPTEAAVYHGASFGILNCIEPYLIYRPVLRRVLKFSKLRDPLPPDITLSVFRSQWNSFWSIVDVMDGWYTEFDRQERFSSMPCGFPACPSGSRFKRNKLRRCTGCKLVFYCSTSCQKQDWKKHWSVCGPNRPPRDLPSSLQVKSFVTLLVEGEIMVNQKVIMRERDALRKLSKPTKGRNRKLYPLVLLIDFSDSPRQSKLLEDNTFIDSYFEFTFPPGSSPHVNCGGQKPTSTSTSASASTSTDTRKPSLPIIAPFARFRYGSSLRLMSVCNELSGNLFGWIDSR